MKALSSLCSSEGTRFLPWDPALPPHCLRWMNSTMILPIATNFSAAANRMEVATVGLLYGDFSNTRRRCAFGQQQQQSVATKGRRRRLVTVPISILSPFRTYLRESRWNVERLGKKTFADLSNLRKKNIKPDRVALVSANLSDTRPGTRTNNMAVLMEVDGVLADVHRYGHRQAFNLSFQELGLDCAQWTEAIFSDLMRSAGGVEEKMLSSFFARIGWPSTLPTNEQEAFIRKVLQVKSRALEKLARSNSIPLRPGVDKFVDEVLEAEVPLVILAAYYKGGEQFARLLVDNLGEERSRNVKFVGEADVESSSYGQLEFGQGISSSLDEQLAFAASRAVAAEKQRIATEVASLLKLSVEIDTSFTQVSKTSIAALRAGAEMVGMDVDHCILLASGLSGSQAASQIGMPCVVVRSSLTARAEFPAAKATLDGYGPGSATLPRLLKFL